VLYLSFGKIVNTWFGIVLFTIKCTRNWCHCYWWAVLSYSWHFAGCSVHKFFAEVHSLNTYWWKKSQSDKKFDPMRYLMADILISYLIENQYLPICKSNIMWFTFCFCCICVCWQTTGAKLFVFPQCCPRSTERAVQVMGKCINIANTVGTVLNLIYPVGCAS